MNTHDLIEQHETAIEKLREIYYKERAKDTLQWSIDGFGGSNFPSLKEDWQKAADRIDTQLIEMKTDYRMFLNSIR